MTVLTYRQRISLGWSLLWRASLPTFAHGFVFGFIGSKNFDLYTYSSLLCWPVVLFVTLPWGAAVFIRR